MNQELVKVIELAKSPTKPPREIRAPREDSDGQIDGQIPDAVSEMPAAPFGAAAAAGGGGRGRGGGRVGRWRTQFLRLMRRCSYPKP